MNILSQNYGFVKTIILSITCPKATILAKAISRRRHFTAVRQQCVLSGIFSCCFRISTVLAVLSSVYVSERYFDNRPVFVAYPDFPAVHFDYFLCESKPYAGISLFARIKPVKNVREIVLVNTVAVVGNRDYRFIVFVYASDGHRRFAEFERVGYEI